MKEWLVSNIVAWKKFPFGVKLAFSFLTMLWLMVLVVDPVNWFVITSISGTCWALIRIMTYFLEGK